MGEGDGEGKEGLKFLGLVVVVALDLGKMNAAGLEADALNGFEEGFRVVRGLAWRAPFFVGEAVRSGEGSGVCGARPRAVVRVVGSV